MKGKNIFRLSVAVMLVFAGSITTVAFAQVQKDEKFSKASKKLERGYKKNNRDTLAQGYFDLGESYYQKGEFAKSESYYKKSKDLFEKTNDDDGVAKSSRALARVQEEMNKDKEAIGNYNTARTFSEKAGDATQNTLNTNDISRLTARPDSTMLQENFLKANLNLGLRNKDTNEIVSNYGRLGEINLKSNNLSAGIASFNNAYQFSRNQPEQALKYNQLITNAYLQNRDFTRAIETKKQVLDESFVENSTKLKASEITSLADIYIQKNEGATAIDLLKQSYALSVKNGHTLEAKKCIEKLDSIYRTTGMRDASLALYKSFLAELPAIIGKDSSLTDIKIVAETEEKLRTLETEKALKDELIREKNMINFWLITAMSILAIFIVVILFILRKLKTKNKKIALQSLRREMNPHFIFNSLNSINQFIANNNELQANQYLTKFSTLMRRVMENSKEDFVLFSKEVELLQNYLELEKSRFTDKFDFNIEIDDELYADEQLKIPGMLIQPHLENAIWHGLRYKDEKGFLKLQFRKKPSCIEIIIEDSGIGIAESKRNKTANQKQHSGRGITNTLERIKILNELYHQRITCIVEDKVAPDHGVSVKMTVPLLKSQPA
jgi:tetratricopeptide (TPR) repeat protein